MEKIQGVRFLIGCLNFEAKRLEQERIRKLMISDLANSLNQTALHVDCTLDSFFVLLLCKSSAISLILEVHFCQLRL